MKLRLLLTWLCLLALPTQAMADLWMPAIFGDHMVLQAEKEAAVWGKADPGQTVVLSIAGQRVAAATDDDGRWFARLPVIDRHGPHTLTIQAGSDRREFEDVLIGEVWLCSGQSNMDWRMHRMPEGEVEAADHPQIRLFRVERNASFEPVEDVEGQWEICTPESVEDFSAAAYYMGHDVHEHLGRPVGLIHTAYGGTTAEVWTRREVLEANPILMPLVERHERSWSAYHDALARWQADPSTRKPTEPQERRIVSGLWNAMVAPIVPYTIRGFAWYQGESNVWRARQYYTLLSEMIIDWRTQWGDMQLPFGVVQLPNYVDPPRVPPGEGSLVELRESQLRVAESLPNTGLIVTIDIGDPTDIHPVNKWTVGERLALWAFDEVYGEEINGQAPVFWEVNFDTGSNEVELKFANAGSGLTTSDGGPVRGFVIADESMRFRWAKARIEGDVVYVSEARVADPKAVRYAWDENPSWANLVSGDGLPVSPFRTDAWPGVTDDAR
ncbi:sialate O-acetylesterase [Mucisphaera sp.]|uniref:sialate O-acetylesterase n=1 Tax=Mucisphaera sp. TaxID=2913024 RepID=UPI003D0FF1F2